MNGCVMVVYPVCLYVALRWPGDLSRVYPSSHCRRLEIGTSSPVTLCGGKAKSEPARQREEIPLKISPGTVSYSKPKDSPLRQRSPVVQHTDNPSSEANSDSTTGPP
ncbi:hypothetical protein ATANTOWER_026739 [Ataeniobius toweri]|uniref:Uncharacterized protein n=1 Tax=Ataeniobius toweri TaxID=208326 RepID=A0ABU7AJF5_9TELE|nr:hypothetical protein [Ataeniobius toweri]